MSSARPAPRHRGRPGPRLVAHAVVALALVTLSAASCGGGDDPTMVDTDDMDAQRALLEQALVAAAAPFSTTPPALEAKRCDDAIDRDRCQWQAGGTVDVPEGRVDALLDEVAAAWDGLDISSARSTVGGAEPSLRGAHGDVRVAVTASAPFDGDLVRVDISGSTGCGRI